MMEFGIENSTIEAVKIITPFFVEDNRGYFLKDYEKSVFERMGVSGEIYEDFESYSHKSVIRGIHFQTKNPQTKLVRAVTGTIHDIAVDLRKGSPTFGKYAEVILSVENHKAIWIPAGFAHGYEVLSAGAIVSYKCMGPYEKGSDTGIRWNDTDLNIKWETTAPIVSDRDANQRTFKEFIVEIGGLLV